jgi:hypothetical protein
LSTSLKRLFGILIVGVALSLGILTALPVMAEAQDMDEASMDVEQNTVKNTGAVVTTQPTTEPPAASRQVVNYGDSLWSIGQKRLGPEATPERILEESRIIYEINRDRIGNDPNLLLVGQELLMPSVPESTPQPVAQGPVAQGPVAQEPVAPAESPAPAESVALPDRPEAQEDIPVAPEVADEEPSSFAPLANLDDNERRRVLGLGIILLTLVVGILMARNLPMNRGHWTTSESDQRESDQREGASTMPGSASPEAAPQVLRVGAANAPREAEDSPSSAVPVYKRLRLADNPPDEQDEDHQRRSSAGGDQ